MEGLDVTQHGEEAYSEGNLLTILARRALVDLDHRNQSAGDRVRSRLERLSSTPR
jgi:hypothetical protein